MNVTHDFLGWLSHLPSRIAYVPRRMWSILASARSHAGHEREIVLRVVKSAVAGVAAWAIANHGLGLSQATFAPFSALLVIYSTLYRSVLNSLRFVGAVVVGVAAAAMAGPVLGEHLLSFALLLLVALLVGQWRRLGSHGLQVSVAAIFAYTAAGAGGATHLVEILTAVFVGAGVGVVVNLAFAPALRFHGVAHAVLQLSQSIRDLTMDMVEHLSHGVPSTEIAQEWRTRAQQLQNTVSKTREEIEHGAEAVRMNPRRLAVHTTISLAGYRTAANALGRAADDLRTVTAELSYAARDDDRQSEEYDRFFRCYAEVLHNVIEAVGYLGHHEDEHGHAGWLEHHVRQGRKAFDEAARQARTEELDSPDQWPTYGALLTAAYRILQELDYAQREGTFPEHLTLDQRPGETT